MFEQRGIHNVLIATAMFERATSRQNLNELVLGYLKKNYQNYKLLDIDIQNRLAICERSDEFETD
ncbi:hypothetical protein [Bacillus pseudomycoides]|uniref:hypothetical protein n=1 Tax=Bacillus pseudomycoides TaxID=64104 RepID=UPI002FFEC1CE